MRVVGSTEIMVISPIDTTSEGPVVPDGAKRWQQVHLRQGSMDGGCGLYSLMMGLIVCGVVRYDDARSFYTFSSKTKIGKLFEYFGKLGPLVKQGINYGQMRDAIATYFENQIICREHVSEGSDIVKFIEKNIMKNHPALLLIEYKGAGHWVLVIGCEFEKQHNEKIICRFLILDPSEDTPKICSWNSVIDLREQNGPYPYRWWPKNGKVQLVSALAIWPRTDK
jgi:hypothetical protein